MASHGVPETPIPVEGVLEEYRLGIGNLYEDNIKLKVRLTQALAQRDEAYDGWSSATRELQELRNTSKKPAGEQS